MISFESATTMTSTTTPMLLPTTKFKANVEHPRNPPRGATATTTMTVMATATTTVSLSYPLWEGGGAPGCNAALPPYASSVSAAAIAVAEDANVATTMALALESALVAATGSFIPQIRQAVSCQYVRGGLRRGKRRLRRRRRGQFR